MSSRVGLLLVSLALSVNAQARPGAGREPSELSRFSQSLEALSERVRPAVVQILTTGYAETGGLLSRQRASGSGVILDPDGYVVTNAHVVQGARRIQVVLAGLASGPPNAQSILKAPGRVVGAVLVGIDRETDVAVLKIAEKNLPFLSLGDSKDLRPGELVLAFGSPLGLENSVTLGVVSAVARQIHPEDRMIYIQTDASINPGSSGGPLVDGEGRVIGINTLILSQSGGNEGIGFAAPSNIVGNVFEQVRKTGRVRRGEIGIYAQTVTPALAAGLDLPQEWGVVLSDVLPGGPGARAGLRIADVVLKLDGKVMENARQLEVNLYHRSVGAVVSLEVRRGAQTLTILPTVTERDRDPDRLVDTVSPERNAVPRLGLLALDLEEVQAQLPGPLRAKAGVVVAAAAPDGSSGADALLPGDVIYSVNQEPVPSVQKLRQVLAQIKPSVPVVVQLERNGGLRFVTFEAE
ncbi:MAG TPA: trypsin-like peptidase domain-containing protein [Vicinamibacteria bacterium]|jgi:serine protease Do|nr:trypsin-like peptidase domain-containing protein [Vicinamibacteria bacterium]